MLREADLIYRSEMAVMLRNTPYLVLGMVQPVLFLFLFGPLLDGMVSDSPGADAGAAWQGLTPGLIVQVAATNGIYTGFALMQHLRSGTLDRLRVTPVSRTAMSVGKAMTPVTLTLVQSVVILVLAAVFFGVSVGVVGALLVLLIAALTSLAIACCSYAVALKLQNEDAFSGVVNITILPLVLLSGILLPITPDSAPTWLFVLSRINPLAYVVDISRASFNENLPLVPTLIGAAVLFTLTALAVRWNTRAFQTATA